MKRFDPESPCEQRIGSDSAMTLRLATVDDARAIADVHVCSWRVAYQGIMPADVLEGLSVERREQLWRGYLSQAEQHRLLVEVAQVGDVVVGFCAVGPSRDDDAAAGVGEVWSWPSTSGLHGGQAAPALRCCQAASDGSAPN